MLVPRKGDQECSNALEPTFLHTHVQPILCLAHSLKKMFHGVGQWETTSCPALLRTSAHMSELCRLPAWERHPSCRKWHGYECGCWGLDPGMKGLYFSQLDTFRYVRIGIPCMFFNSFSHSVFNSCINLIRIDSMYWQLHSIKVTIGSACFPRDKSVNCGLAHILCSVQMLPFPVTTRWHLYFFYGTSMTHSMVPTMSRLGYESFPVWSTNTEYLHFF